MTTENWIGLPTMQNVAKAQTDGWEVAYRHKQSDEWDEWNGCWWDDDYVFRGRPLQQKMKEVKMLCWFANGVLFWHSADEPPREHWIRQLHLDMVAQVPE